MSYRPYTELQTAGLVDTRANNTGVTIPKATPVRINSSGTLDFMDVSVESEALSTVGIASQSISNGAQGAFVSSGRVSNITTSANLGDTLYIDKIGGLTNIKPSTGVNGFSSGDFVIQVGVVAKNELNPALKDLIVSIEVIGQL